LAVGAAGSSLRAKFAGGGIFGEHDFFHQARGAVREAQAPFVQVLEELHLLVWRDTQRAAEPEFGDAARRIFVAVPELMDELSHAISAGSACHPLVVPDDRESDLDCLS